MDALLDQGRGTALAWLEVTGGPAAGQRIVIEGDARFGSEEPGPAALGGDRWLSPSHAAVRRTSHGWTIEDLRSAEGTKVNGQTVRGATVLHDGDTIEMGSSRLVVVGENSVTERPGTDLRNADLRPLWRRRRRAWLIDRLLFVPVGGLIGYLAHGRTAILIAYTALGLSYHFVCEALTGQTLGKSLMGVRVVDIEGRPVRPQAIAARAFLLLLDTFLPIALISMLLTGKRRQRLGDLAARTVVAPASVPFAPSTSRRDRLTMWAYPLVWLAPAALLFAFAPWASAPTCGRDALLHEGTCHWGATLFDIKEAGHSLHMDGFDADLVATGTRQLADGGETVSFSVRLTNSGAGILDPRTRVHAGLGVVDENGVLEELAPHGPSKPRPLAPHASGDLKVRFVVPASMVHGIGYAPSHLTLVSTSDPTHIGWISLWLWAGAKGENAIRGLSS